MLKKRNLRAKILSSAQEAQALVSNKSMLSILVEKIIILVCKVEDHILIF